MNKQTRLIINKFPEIKFPRWAPASGFGPGDFGFDRGSPAVPIPTESDRIACDTQEGRRTGAPHRVPIIYYLKFLY